MFIYKEKYCQVQIWFHDLPHDITQATLYVYETEEDFKSHKNEIASDIYRFPYDPSLESFTGIEEAIEAKLKSGE